jgi:hypothetical protein
MGLLVAILVVAAALLGFLFLTSVERKRGRRFFEGVRETLDTKVESATAYVSSTDARASLKKTVRSTIDHVAHEVVHAILQVVRFVERTLTRITREIRGRRAKENESSVE